ncbi:MAG: RNA-binding protein [Candidatus Omnitrophica bacterium]|nr:RNA-binding protein [Candidatus Omnitrophota bacterium]
MRIYVGNLSWEMGEDELRALFEPFGKVDSATIVADKFTGESRGFAFVDMPDQAQAQAAINGLNGQEVKGRALKVNEARPRSERGPERRHSGGNFRGHGGRRRY